MPSNTERTVSQTTVILLSLLIASLLGGFAISNQSLWIDEGHSAAKAMQPTLSGWWATMTQDKGSDLQMPLYMFYLWAWAKVFGTSEIALRTANLPWFVAGILSLLCAFRLDRHRQLAVALLALSSAFLWYYLDEARPYMMLFAFSALAAGCLFRLHEDPASTESPTWVRLFMLGIVGLCAANMIAVPWAMGALAAFVFWAGPRAIFRASKHSLWITALAGFFLIALALYYLWSLQLGARGSDVGRTSVATLGFAFYELLGLAGLGPSRLVLRADGSAALFSHAREVGIGAIAILTLCAAGVDVIRAKTKRRDFIYFALAIALPLGLVIIAAELTHMRLLGRHLTPLLPFLLVLSGVGLQSLLSAKRIWLRIGAVVALLVLLFSSLQIRFAPRHRHDDYRSAVLLAQRALGDSKKVWWLADETTAGYYKLPLSSAQLTLRSTLSEGSFDASQTPDIVCLSKPDIYDSTGKIDNYLREHNFKVTQALPAFQIFERQAAPR